MSAIFEGVNVVEVAQFVFGPAAGAVLADHGADVIKVERTGSGDPQRGLGPSFDGVDVGNEQVNRGKRSIRLDLADPRGRAVLGRLVERADVFLTNYLPPARTKLGLDEASIRDLNEPIVYASATSMGSSGPDSDRPGYDATAYWARGGIATTLTTGTTPPTQPGSFGDKMAAMNLAFGIAGALFERARTGRGVTVETSLYATALWQNSSAISYSLSAGTDIRRQDQPIVNPLVNTYRTADDRWVALVMQDIGRFWPDLCSRLGRTDLIDDPRFVDPVTLVANGGECIEELTRIFGGAPLDVWRERLAGALGAWEPLQTILESANDSQVAPNGYIQDVEIGGGAIAHLVAAPVQFDGQPAILRRAPKLGEHSAEILRVAGYSDDSIAELRTGGVI